MSQADAHAHDHPDFLGHHWESPKQQFEAGKFGMWLFLATEVLFFGGLFCAYTLWRYHHPEMFKFGSQFLDTTMGAINTGVLIASSLTMATAVTMAQKGKQKELIICLVLTLAGAFGFLGIKYVEYKHKFDEGYLPGKLFYGAFEGENAGSIAYRVPDGHSWDASLSVALEESVAVDTTARPFTNDQLGLPAAIPVDLPATGGFAEAPTGMNVGALGDMEVKRARSFLDGAPHAEEGAMGGEHATDAHADQADHGPGHPLQDLNRPANSHMFFNIYFMMTGLHGVHVILGIVMLIWLIWRSARGEFGKDYFTPIDLGGLYWHIVDLIWIFLFPLFYLI